MRQDVCIVLNERESLKAKAALDLETRLTAKDITVSRIPVTPRVADVVLAREPRVVILDYLLGDYSTGIDVLTKLNSLPLEDRPKTIFFTDEPSVAVAIEAMRLGALHYLGIEDPLSLSAIVKEVSQLLEEKPEVKKAQPPPSLDDLVFTSAAGQKLLTQCKAAALSNSKILVIQGNTGSGRKTLARAIRAENNLSSAEFDLRSYTGSLEQIFRESLHAHTFNFCENFPGIILFNVEEEGFNLINTLSEQKLSQIRSKQPPIILTTNDESLAAAFKRELSAEVVRIPPLASRKEDIPALAHRFYQEAIHHLGKKIPALSREALAWISGHELPGEVRELRDILFSAAAKSTFEKSPLETLVSEAATAWESDVALHSSEVLPPLHSIVTIFENSGHDVRTAAARLGITRAALKHALQGVGAK